MSTRISAFFLFAALALSPTAALCQDRKDGGTGDAKGQSERPSDPKQTEPESSSHNADKPKTPAELGHPPRPPASTGPTHPNPPKKD